VRPPACRDRQRGVDPARAPANPPARPGACQASWDGLGRDRTGSLWDRARGRHRGGPADDRVTVFLGPRCAEATPTPSCVREARTAWMAGRDRAGLRAQVDFSLDIRFKRHCWCVPAHNQCVHCAHEKDPGYSQPEWASAGKSCTP
jgi:hypothetical protein